MTNIKVQYKNFSFLQIECDPGIANELSDFFCFYVPNYKFMPSYKNKFWDGKVRLFDVRTRELPAGLFKYLKEFADTPGRDYSLELIHNNYYGIPAIHEEVDPSFMKDITYTSGGKEIFPKDYQEDAVRHALTNKRAMLISPTASGKSLIIYTLIRWYLENHDKKVIIIVPTTSLVEQMYKDFADYSEYDETFSSEDNCHRIYSGREKYSEQRVIITTWQSVYKLQGQYFEPFGMVVGDEAHNFKAKSLTSILSKCREAEYRFGTTGTLDGTEVHKLVL